VYLWVHCSLTHSVTVSLLFFLYIFNFSALLLFCTDFSYISFCFEGVEKYRSGLVGGVGEGWMIFWWWLVFNTEVMVDGDVTYLREHTLSHHLSLTLYRRIAFGGATSNATNACYEMGKLVSCLISRSSLFASYLDPVPCTCCIFSKSSQGR